MLWNKELMETYYEQWCEDPKRVEPRWRAFFDGWTLGQETTKAQEPSSRGIGMVMAYRAFGHKKACLNPLRVKPQEDPELALDAYSLTPEDMQRVFSHRRVLEGRELTLGELQAHMEAVYCGTLALETRHMGIREEREWLYTSMESGAQAIETADQLKVFESLVRAECLERFLHTRYVGQKRFSLEGLESLIPGLELLIEGVAQAGVLEVVMGMAHRGRLNVLTHVFKFPMEELLKTFEGPWQLLGKGADVKYHKGYVHEGTPRLVLCDNSSHLESVYPVALGRARGRQRIWAQEKGLDTIDRQCVLPIVIHGDAAFMGQGIVAETLNAYRLPGYHVGGTLHIVLNNHVGFTANPDETRSTLYCTDIAKMVEAPVFHVNADDPVAVLRALRLAWSFRKTFARDVVVELSGYRRYGHNESDEPRFTQPELYQKIEQHPTCSELLAQALESQGLIEAGRLEVLRKSCAQERQKILDKLHQHAPKVHQHGPCRVVPYTFESESTGVERAQLAQLADKLLHAPQGFNLNPKIERQMQQKRQRMASGEGLDWALGESLAWASLLHEGIAVRLSGQDSRRGTFSHRHAVFYDTQTGQQYMPLNHLGPGQAQACIYNSSLSEAAILAFDYGYEQESPRLLCLWEAQFGDFVNGAQIILDQYLSSAEIKWGTQSGLVLLLPHGYEGQGPEHSSARIERFLQSCADDNWQITYPSTPAQYFHLLRRQAKRSFKKPLVVFSPKSLLRHPKAVSRLQDFTQGHFQSVLPDPAPPSDPEILVLCSGKVYYDLLAQRDAQSSSRFLLLRLEQYYPLDTQALSKALRTHTSIKHFHYCQEEPENMGAWSFLRPHLESLLPPNATGPWRYCGRPASASTATGTPAQHALEHSLLLEAAASGR